MNDQNLQSRINQLTGNMMGIQTLLLSVIATSGKRVEIANHLREETDRLTAVLNAESGLPDETLHTLEHWLASTLDMLVSDEDL